MRVAPPPPRPAAPPRRRATVLVVVNVLPVLFSRAADGSGWRVEWNSTATAMFYRTLVGESSAYEPLFVGCPEVFVPREEEAAVEKLLEPFRCVPVFLNPTVAHNYFQGFCKGMLWPIFHNVVDVYNAAPLTLDEAEGDTQRSSPPWSAQESSSGEFVPQSCWRDPASWNPAAQDRCWADYCSVNRTFARRVVESYHEGDLIWVQDFYFLMLPSYLLRRLRNAIVTLYLHVPFPSSEVFRCLAMRTEIIRAMLCADHIGFLLFEHARHFLTSCKRMLGLNYKTNPNGMLVMEYNGREIYVSCSHVEPDMTHLFQMLQGNPDGDARAIEFRKGIEKFIYYHDGKSGNRRKKLVISSADRLEGLTGLPLKLRAFNRFLSLHPDMRKSVVLVQIGLTLDSRPNDYKQTRDYVVRFAEEINRRWGTPEEPLVVFQEKAKTTCAERMQLWQMTDIYFDTCVRGGLWLFPFEFMVVQRHHEELNAQHFVDRDRYEFGVMIASEFASYSRVLNGCLSVNPWKTEDLVNALAKATEMTSYEKQSRFRLSYKFMEGPLESNKWGERLLEDLESTIPKKNRVSEREIIEVGFGFDFRVVQFESGFARLDVDNLVKRYSKSSRRLFIFDYGGTLSATTSVFDEDSPITYLDAGLVESVSHYGGNGSSFESNGFGDRTDQRIRFVDGNVRSPISLDLRDNLVELCSDGRNIVFVISAGHRAELEREFGSIPHLNLIADNGLFIRSGRANGWECTCENDLHLFDWKYNVKQVMIAYAGRTNGAYIRESEASLVYDYRNSDPEYGEIQSLELYEQLRRVVKREEATVCRSKGYVEVHQAGISKASVLTMILATLRQQIALPDLVFYAGDDDSDELAFRALYNTVHGEVTPENVITCTIGKKPSCAKAYADSVSDILAAVQALAIRVRLQRTRTSILPEMRRSFRDSLELLDHVVTPLSVRSLEHWGSDVDLVSASLILSESELHAADAGSLSRRLGRLVRGDVDWLSVGVAVAAGCAVGFLAAGGHKRVAAIVHRRLLPPST